MLRRCPTTPTNRVHQPLLKHRCNRFGEPLSIQRVHRLPLLQHRQSRVGHHRDRSIPKQRQRPHMVHHLHRTRRAVQTKRRDRHRTQRLDRRFNRRPHQHRPSLLDRHRHKDRDRVLINPKLPRRLTNPLNRALDLQQVLTGLDEHDINPALDQPHRRLRV